MDEHLPFAPLPEWEVASKGWLTTFQKAESVRMIEIFSEATVEQLFQLANVARETELAAREIIFREDEPSDTFYMIVEGQVELVSVVRGVREVVGPGGSFGLHSVLTHEPRCVTATVLQPTFAIAIEAEDFYNLLSENTQMVAKILRYLAQKCINPWQ